MAKHSIKDTDYLFASARIKSMEKNLLSREKLERMSEAKSLEEAFKILNENGWPEVLAPTLPATEEMLAARRSEAFALVRNMAPDKRLPDVFLIKYDYHNIKTILKGEATGQDPLPLLIEAGRIPGRSLLVMLREENYADLTKTMVSAIAEAKDVLARTQDPQLLDFVLDKAMYRDMLDMAGEFGSDYLTGYVRLMIDSVNLRTAVRLRRMGKGIELLRHALIPGGNIGSSRLLNEITPDLIETIFGASSLAPAAVAGAAALRGEGSLAALDLACDDVLLRYLKGAKYVAFGAEPLIGYLAAVEAELTAVRTVVAGRLADLSAEMIIERLRETYV